MRLVQRTPSVLRLGRARATRYGWRHTWPGLSTDRFPLIRISETGGAERTGELVTLAAKQSVWLPGPVPFDGLPIELTDVRPQGFLGRHFAGMHPDLGLPPSVSDWSDHHVLLALSRRGEDMTGNLIVGEESFQRWQALPYDDIPRTEFDRLADAALAGHPPGSSAGGERPKFGVFSHGRHVLVKFAGRGASDSAAGRWSDLLVLEVLALTVAAQHGLATARTELVQSERHTFLESERFDRVARKGRRAVRSLAAVSGDPSTTWSAAAVLLQEHGRLSREDASRLRWLDAFGALIGNTDRHQYNVAFFRGTAESLTLAPAFDLVPMFYAPAADGRVLADALPPARQTADTLDVWADARAAAHEFWRRASDDRRISEDLRRAAAVNVERLRRDV